VSELDRDPFDHVASGVDHDRSHPRSALCDSELDHHLGAVAPHLDHDAVGGP